MSMLSVLPPLRKLLQRLSDLFVSDLELRLRHAPSFLPLVFREARPEDAERCMQLYLANESGRFPPCVRKVFGKDLSRFASGRFMVELEGQTVATCQASFWFSHFQGMLSYGLTDPAFQRRGIGTAMLLFRLVLIARQAPNWEQWVSLTAVDDSAKFYRRFGFYGNKITYHKSDIGEHELRLHLTQQMARRCEEVLSAAGMVVPPFELPLYTKEDWKALIQDESDSVKYNHTTE
jgi:GNAT superfamily N-acetyltransferase